MISVLLEIVIPKEKKKKKKCIYKSMTQISRYKVLKNQCRLVFSVLMYSLFSDNKLSFEIFF